MNIILGQENASAIAEKYIVLELDTLKIDKELDPVTAYCLVEISSLTDLLAIESLRVHHAKMMENYKERRWEQCQRDVESLMGTWNGELDSFYSEINNRLINYISDEPGPDWTPVLNKVSVS